MLSEKLIRNKFYVYAGDIVKIKKISKQRGKILVERLRDKEFLVVPLLQHELLLSRLYTVGEVAKILGKRPDTLRKYERANLIPSAKKFGEECIGYTNWRYYDEAAVYELTEFFGQRVQGRPLKKTASTVEASIETINHKIKMHK
jgi:hypothetical protein